MTMKMSLCMRAITTLEDQDSDALADAIETYRNAGLDDLASEIAAVHDVLEGVRAERTDLIEAIREQLGEEDAGQVPADQGRDDGEGRPGVEGQGERGQDLQRAAQAGREAGDEGLRKATPDDFTQEGVSDILERDGWAILTAENPANTESTDADNVARTDRLRQRLIDSDIKFIEVRGRYSEGERPEERSFIVFADKRTAMGIGLEFGQESILTREGLVYEDGRIDEATGIVNVFDKVPENYYTRIPGEPWAFSVDIDFKQQEPKFAKEETGDEDFDADGVARQTILAAAKKIIEKNNYTPLVEQNAQTMRVAVDRLKKDIKAELAKDRGAAEWYRDNLNEALAQVADVFPEVGTDPAARQAFIAALAITSNGTTIEGNVFAAMDLYNEYRIDPAAGLPVRGTGVRRVNMEKAISKFNELVELLGPADAAEFLATPFRAGDLKQMVGLSGWPVDYEIYGSAIFGPKIGHGFFSNLSGRFNSVTMDRWFFRTWGRVTGRLIFERQSTNKKTGKKEAKEVLLEVRATAYDRAFAHDAINQLVEELNAEGIAITQAGVQAVLWYHEKSLYDSYGAANAVAKPTDYSTEVRKFIENHGLQPSDRGGRDTGQRPVESQAAAGEVPFEEQGVISAEPLFSLEAAGPVEPSGRPGAVSLTGVHYSTGKRFALSGSFFGRGIKGAERERVELADDQRLKKRIYFYVADRDATRPLPGREMGLGGEVHRARLDNLYDPRTGVFKFKGNPGELESDRLSRWESGVLDSGYDGYINWDYGIAVVLGQDSIPVDYIGNAVDLNVRPRPLPPVPRERVLEPKLSVELTDASKAELQFMLQNSAEGSGDLNGSSIDGNRLLGDAEAMDRLASAIQSDYGPDGLESVSPATRRSMLALADRIRSTDQRTRLARAKAIRSSPANKINLPPVDTPAFKKWFGDSKVVDENGEPLVVYHGTPGETMIESFDVGRANQNDPDIPVVGFHFTSREKDARAAGLFPYGRQNARTTTTTAAYLSIKNPALRRNVYRVAREIGGGTNAEITNALIERGYDGVLMEKAPVISAQQRSDLAAGKRVEFRKGHYLQRGDGVEYYSDSAGGFVTGYDSLDDFLSQQADHWVAFRPEQIKSVYNRGTFDPTDARISYSMEDDFLDDWSDVPPDATEGMTVGYTSDTAELFRSERSKLLPKVPDYAAARLGREWLELGKNKDLYTYPKSKELSLENIAYDMGGRGVKVRSDPTTRMEKEIFGGGLPSEEMARMGLDKFVPVEKHTLTMPLTKEQTVITGDRSVDAFVYVDEFNNVAMNISNFTRNVTNGNLIYQIVGTWAHNNGYRFIGDPAGLSEEALFRRAENMFVNALRTGSTRHLYPHPYQIDAGLRWIPGEHDFNIGQLALFGRDSLKLFRPELYNQAAAMAGVEKTEGSQHPFAGDVAAKLPAGQRTLSRVAMTERLLRRAAENAPEVESFKASEDPDFMPLPPGGRILYSLPHTMTDVVDVIHDSLRSEKKVTYWDKTIGTQLNKARKFPAFAAVYNRVQKFMNDTSMLANTAADHAPDILRKMEHWTDAFRGVMDELSPKGRADRKAASKLLMDGTAADRVWSDDEMRERGATDRHIALYRQMRKAINTSLDQVAVSEMYRLTRNIGLDEQRERIIGMPADRAREFLMVEMAQLPFYSQAQQEGLQFIRNEITEKARRIQHLKATGYAPMMRFGKYAVGFTIDGERAFNMFENERDRNAFIRDLEKAGATNITTSTMSQKEFELYRGFDTAALELFGEMTTLEYYDEEGNVRKASVGESQMFQEFLKRSIASQSAMKRLIHRKKVPGYSEDGSRILAQFITSNARMASRNMNMQEMIQLAAKADGPLKKDGDIKDEAVKLVKYVNEGQEEAQALRGLLFVNFLGGSVASALVNMTQPITMSYPYLAQFGATKAVSALQRGFAQAVSRKRPGGQLGQDLLLAEEQGVVSPQEIHHLYAEASRTLGSNPILRRSLLVWGSLFSAAEQFNRRATFIAAWEMAGDMSQQQLDSMGFKNRFEFAKNATVETQGIYNRGNRPDWARGAVGATVFTFKQFSIHYLEFFSRLPKREKAIALGILVLLSGLNGLPFADDLDDLIDSLAQNAGYAWNTKAQKRQFVSSLVPKELAEFLLSGISTLPGVPIDVQGRMSMGNFIPGSAAFKPNATVNDVLEIAGPAGGWLGEVIKGTKAAASGEPFEAVLGFSPVAVKNFLKGADMIQTGAYRDSRGRKVVDADFTDAVSKIIGFMPPKAAQATRVERTVQELVSVARTARSDIAGKWAEGMFTRNNDLIEEAREELTTWNRRNPEMRIDIKMKDVVERVKQMRMTRAERIAASAPRSMRATAQARLEQER